MPYNYIIYHDNCVDGFTGFYLFMKTDKWEPKPTVYPDQPYAKSVPPDVDGKNVIIIDVAYKPEILLGIMDRAKKVLFIDHHVTLNKDIKKLVIKPPHEIFYDENYSGASLVWKYFYGNKKIPRFVKYVEDNDIGRWQYPETLPFVAGLEVNFGNSMEPSHENLKKWDKLLDNKFLDNLIDSGKKYEVYKNFLINRQSTRYSLMYFPSQKVVDLHPGKFTVGQYSVAVTNSHCPSVSLLGKKIAETADVDFVILWNYIVDKKKYIVSLRSIKADVGEIAKIMGGGGHKFASNFSMAQDLTIDDLFS